MELVMELLAEDAPAVEGAGARRGAEVSKMAVANRNAFTGALSRSFLGDV